MTLTVRRSVVADAPAATVPSVAAALGDVAFTSDVPHSPQNFALGLLTAPQAGHPEGSCAPHSAQNLRPASFWVEQFGQITVPSCGATAARAERSPLGARAKVG
jgi:hypothetical protein